MVQLGGKSQKALASEKKFFFIMILCLLSGPLSKVLLNASLSANEEIHFGYRNKLLCTLGSLFKYHSVWHGFKLIKPAWLHGCNSLFIASTSLDVKAQTQSSACLWLFYKAWVQVSLSNDREEYVS